MTHRAVLLASLGLWASGFADESSCLVCHVMRPRQQALRSGPHQKGAVCGDCHEPHQGALARIGVSASAGIRHLYRNLLVKGDAAIASQAENSRVVQANCVRCHPADPSLVPPGPAPRPKAQPRTSAHAEEGRSCQDCHRETSHPAPERKHP